MRSRNLGSSVSPTADTHATSVFFVGYQVCGRDLLRGRRNIGKLLVSFAVIAARTSAETRAAINPYSIAAAPDSSFKNFLIMSLFPDCWSSGILAPTQYQPINLGSAGHLASRLQRGPFQRGQTTAEEEAEVAVGDFRTTVRIRSMTRKRHTAEEIVAKLRQVDVLMAQGARWRTRCER